MAKTVFLILLQLIFLPPAIALQVHTAGNHQTVKARIAAADLTRIFVAGDRIETVRGLAASFFMTRDEKAGAIFIRPQPLFQHRSFSLFLATEHGLDYTLHLEPVMMAADNIELKPVAEFHHFPRTRSIHPARACRGNNHAS